MLIKVIIFFGQLFCCTRFLEQQNRYSAGTSNFNVMQTLYNVNNRTDIESKNLTTNYFKNLNQNFGLNINGSCTYVATGMLLSYYDAFYDDSFIDEKYEAKSTISNSPINCESPGNKSDTYMNYFQNAGYEWGKYIETNRNNYFDYYLISKFDPKLSSYGGFQTIDPVSAYDQYWNLRSYFLMDRGLNNGTVEIYKTNSSDEDFDENLKKQIANGVPVMLNVQLDEIGAHTVVAYDYDEKDNSFVVHSGWKKIDGTALTCVTLKDLKCKSIDSALYLEYRSIHNHCDNYVKNNDSDYCICKSFEITDINSKGKLYRDVNPSFAISTNMSKDLMQLNRMAFKVSLKTHIGTAICTSIENCDGLSFTLGDTAFSELLAAIDSNGFILECEMIYPNIGGLFKKQICFSKEFSFVNETTNTHLIRYDDYDMGNAYVDNDEIKTNFQKQKTINGFTFYTRRFRTGKPTYKYVTLSPRRHGYTEAYIEYYFEKCLDRLDIQLSMWSTAKEEHIGKKEGEIKIQVLQPEREYYDYLYRDVVNVLEDGKLPENQLFRTYVMTFDKPVNVVRVYTNTFVESSNKSNNFGRVCIGDIYAFENKDSKKQPVLPTSGSELPYEPSYFNSISYMKNCYCYAFNITSSSGPVSPGNSWGLGKDNTYEYFSKFTLQWMTKLDAIKYGFYFEPIGKFEKCAEGHYKVALVANQTKEEVDGQLVYKEGYADYHWYRQNPDGSWSHKPGRCLVRSVDYNCNLIMDPENCVRKSREDVNYNDVPDELAYDVFIGFYEVSSFSASYYEDKYSY